MAELPSVGPTRGLSGAAVLTQCTSDGYVSRLAFDYHLIVGGPYANAAEGRRRTNILFSHAFSNHPEQAVST